MPILYRETSPDALSPEVARINWIDFGNHEFETSLKPFLQALNTDIPYVKNHTRLLVRAVEWDRKFNNTSYLLRGSDLREAEQWMLQEAKSGPLPTTLHKRYLSHSRRAETRRLLRIIMATLTALITTITLSVLAFFAWQLSERQLIASTAKSTHLLSEANQGFEALMEGQRAAHKLDQLSWIAKDTNIQNQVLLALQEAVYGVREFNRLEGHKGSVHGVAISPDGLRYLSASADGTVKLWRLDSSLVQSLHGHKGDVWSVAISPDGQIIASGSADQTVRRWRQDGTIKLWDHDVGWQRADDLARPYGRGS